MQCCGVCFPEYTIVYEHDKVDKIIVDYMETRAYAVVLHLGQGSEVDLLVHTKSRQTSAVHAI